MPSKKKKYNARFPAGRIKKIMQTDEEVGKVAQAVPVIISRTLELFVESLIKKSMQITIMKNARTLSPHHMKLCILSESRFDFLRDLVKSVPEVSNSDDDLSSFTETPSVSLPLQEERRNSRDSGFSQSTQKVEVSKEQLPQQPAVHCLNFYTERDTSVTEQMPIPSHSGDHSKTINDTPQSSYLGNNRNSTLKENSFDKKSSGVTLQSVNRSHSELSTKCDDSNEEEDYDT